MSDTGTPGEHGLGTGVGSDSGSAPRGTGATRAGGARTAGRQVAIIGGGWSGLAAAVEAVDAGHQVTLYEAARSLGGRARSLPLTLPDGRVTPVDNGQHILIGAYRQTLGLMAKLGVDPRTVFEAQPLDLRDLDGHGLQLPAWPAPLDAAWGIARARGWSWADKRALLATTLGWRARGFRCRSTASVADLCAKLPAPVMQGLIEPLCVSALNTPPEQASGQVFLRVLNDALFGEGWGDWGASWLLLPKAPLGELLPEPAARWLSGRGATLRLGHRISLLAQTATGWQVDGDAFDAVVLACPSWDAIRLLQDNAVAAPSWLLQAHALRHEAITTVYAVTERRLPRPMVALRSGPGEPAQFVFDRGQLGGPAGLLAFVVSASHGEREMVERLVMAQADALGWDEAEPLLTVVERRATFACTPGLERPGPQVAERLWACGDWVAGPYPATLEGAVMSGRHAAAALGKVRA